VQDLREVCKSTAAERQASQGLLSSSVISSATSTVPIATQAAAKSIMMQSGTYFIPPLPVKLPDNLDFSLPPLDDFAVNDKISGTTDKKSSPPQLVQMEDRRSQESSSLNEGKRINTKALLPNSVYSPPTPVKKN
jgi:hypothetical protein